MTNRLTPSTDPETRMNKRGNTVSSWGYETRALAEERYYWDFGPCSAANGWVQYDTKQDASYFGVWVHVGTRRTLTYCEGDLSLVECPAEDSFKAELAHMAEFYGEPPPALKVIHADGSRTDIYCERPNGGHS